MRALYFLMFLGLIASCGKNNPEPNKPAPKPGPDTTSFAPVMKEDKITGYLDSTFIETYGAIVPQNINDTLIFSAEKNSGKWNRFEIKVPKNKTGFYKFPWGHFSLSERDAEGENVTLSKPANDFTFYIVRNNRTVFEATFWGSLYGDEDHTIHSGKIYLTIQ